MSKAQPNIKESIPYLSGKERAKLFFENMFSTIKFLTSEEEKLLSKMETQKQANEWWEYFGLVVQRIVITIIFFNAVSELRSKIAVLSSLYSQICYEIPLRTIQQFLDVGAGENKEANTSIAKTLLADFMNKISVTDSKLDTERIVEGFSFTEKIRTTLKGTVENIFGETERLVNMREALQKLDEQLGKPQFPDRLSGERLNECLREIKSAQKLNNKTVFTLLKYRPPHLSVGFKREIEDLDAYIIKTPKIKNDLVKQYTDFMFKK